MKSRALRWGIIALLVGAGVTLVLQGTQNRIHASSPRIYRVVEVPSDSQSMQAVLNEYGGAGWELVTIGMGEMQIPRLIFKKSDDAPAP